VRPRALTRQASNHRTGIGERTSNALSAAWKEVLRVGARRGNVLLMRLAGLTSHIDSDQMAADDRSGAAATDRAAGAYRPSLTVVASLRDSRLSGKAGKPVPVLGSDAVAFALANPR
jgi:hypothetical protein